MAQNRAHPTVFGCRGEYLGALTGGEGVRPHPEKNHCSSAIYVTQAVNTHT